MSDQGFLPVVVPPHRPCGFGEKRGIRPPGLGFFDCAGVRLMLDAPAKAQGENYSSIIYYKVPDLQAAFEALAGRGVVFEAKPHLIAKLPDHELWMAFFRDPDQNLLALMSEVR